MSFKVGIMVVSVVIGMFSETGPASAGHTEAFAYGCETMDRYHEVFFVYSDMNCGGNHFYPTGWMGDSRSTHMDQNWSSNCYSGTSCIKVTYTGVSPDWVAVYWQDPENNWGTSETGGHDLTGASRLRFKIRGETGTETAAFFAGGIQGPYPDSLEKTSTGYQQLGDSWQDRSIELAGKNLGRVIGGFGFETPAVPGRPVTVFFLDDIRYDLPRLQVPRFAASYKTLSSVTEPDSRLTNICYLYDNALFLLALTARGLPEDLRRAGLLADAILYGQTHDPDFADGRLRNAYRSGDVADHQFGKARLAGWADPVTGKWFNDAYGEGSETGNLCWAVIALLTIHEKTGDGRYLDAARTLGNWVESNTRDTRGAGGYTGGLRKAESGLVPIAWKSTEQNIDAYVAFKRLHATTGDSKWLARADHARAFVEAMWDPGRGHFWTGTLDDGVTINTAVVPVDAQAWAVLAFREYAASLYWAEDHLYLESGGFKGYDFNTDLDGIWFEGTAQMALAFQTVGEFQRSSVLISELRKAQASAPNADGKGIVAASRDGVSTGFGWDYYSRQHIGATAWYIFAELHHNPFWNSCTHPGVLNASEGQYDDSIQAAYSLAESGHRLRCVGRRFGEALTLDRDIEIVLEGGYLCNHATLSAWFSEIASLRIDAGKTILGGFVIQPAVFP